MIIFRWSGSLQIYDEMYMRVIGTAGADLGGGGRVQGPPPTRLSNTTGILQKKKLCGLLMLRVKYKTRWRIVNGLAANQKKNGPYV